MKINLGPAGSPVASTFEGIYKVKELGLQSMEVQFSHGIKMSIELAKKCGAEAKKLGIELSLHAPYFLNLASEEKKKQEESKQRILDSAERGHYLGAREIVFHPAYFGKGDKEKVFQTTKNHILDMMETIKKKGWNVALSPEITGKHSALGSLDETIRLVKETGCSFNLDFAHLYARNYGKINYKEILDEIQPLKSKHIQCHFSNISYTSKGERNHEILDHHPPFEPLAKEILERKLNITIISESPVTWKDSLKMKGIFEKLGYRFE
ncbi:MAG: TIM barrel protein [Candidatus Aenigmarchaeota archaeon]|nr:TIM barrel protein [Candidatus Aenigmarchaeota archaeon]